MDISASQFSSASESGWTRYLDQSSLSGNYFQMSGGMVEYGGKEKEEEEEEEEEDLSMVSDASSGPPHYHDEDDECYYEDWYPYHSSSSISKEERNKNKNKNQKVKESIRLQQSPHLDDDTASSPVFSCSKKSGIVENALDFSQGFSATRLIKGKPKFQKHFGFFECSLGGKQAAKKAGGFGEENRK